MEALKIRRIIGVICLVFLPLHLGFADKTKLLRPKIMLDHIKIIKSREYSGDELYFDMSVFKPQRQKTYVRVPKGKAYWHSSALAGIKKVPLWGGTLENNEEINVVISLMEQDISPLNPDNLIGSVQLSIKNSKGQLVSQWNIPNRDTGLTTIDAEKRAIQEVTLSDGQAQYIVYFYLSDN